jgi:hypothetical protein
MEQARMDKFKSAAHKDAYCLANSKIADLIRIKLTSGNTVPVERCVVFTKEIKKIDDEVIAKYGFSGNISQDIES